MTDDPGSLARLVVDVVVDAPVDAVWAAVTDWDRQSDWVLGTQVQATDKGGIGLGGGVHAFTGVRVAGRRVGVLDTMVITEWEPPNRCTVKHTGRVVRGLGVFEVFGLPDGRSRFVWTELIELPLGVVGRLGWPLARPLVAVGIQASLNKLARSVEAEQDGAG